MKYLAAVLPDYPFDLFPAMNSPDLDITNRLLAPGGAEEKLRMLREKRAGQSSGGVYSTGSTDHDAFIKLNRKIENNLCYNFCVFGTSCAKQSSRPSTTESS